MITYFYWFCLGAVIVFLLWTLGLKAKQWRGALISSAVILVFGWGLHFFYLENLFVKRFGGVMTIKTPAGQQHLGTTWKDDNLWVETYDPLENTCYFYEYSRGNLLEGRVIIKDCDPYKP